MGKWDSFHKREAGLAVQKPTNKPCISNLQEKNTVIFVDVGRAFDKFKTKLWLWKSIVKKPNMLH